MNLKKHEVLTSWFLIGLNLLSLAEKTIVEAGFSIFEKPEFQNILLLAIICQLRKNATVNDDESKTAKLN
ncbi:MAG: hypothetical protein VXZ36_04545 [Pseudomonadota bacterium]|jgi:hypothetical protein|nr:hypothetical protein [Pseudomonadota bacterium]